MMHIRQSRHSRRIFFRYLRQSDKEKETERNLSAQSQVAPNEEPTNNPPPRKIFKWAIVAAVCLCALIITIITINAVSCSTNRKIVLDSGNVTTQTNTLTFSTTARRKKAEEYKTAYVTLNVFNKTNEKIYCDYKAINFWSNTISVPCSFQVDKYLVSHYDYFNFELKANEPNIDKPQLKHKFTAVSNTIPATCLESGTKYYKCNHCDIKKPETIPALGHNFVLSSQTKATCTTDGQIIYKCSRCSQTKAEITKALGHKWGDTSCLNCGLKMQRYKLTMKNTLISNGGVGNEWSHSWKYNNKYIENGAVIYAPPDSTISVMAIIIEHDDASSDVGVETLKVNLTNGYIAKGEVIVVEDRGKYARSKAVWNVTITVTKIS